MMHKYVLLLPLWILGLGAVCPSAVQAQAVRVVTGPGIEVHGLTTLLRTDSAAAPVVGAMLDNIDSLVTTEVRALREGRFTADTFALKRLGFHALHGLNIEILSGSEWFAINATLPGVLAVTRIGLTDAGMRGFNNGGYGVWPDTSPEHRDPRRRPPRP